MRSANAITTILVAGFSLAACARDSVRDAEPRRPPASPAPRASPSPASSAPAPAPGLADRACEPTVQCGVWSGCKWLRRLDDGTFRTDDGEVYVRRRECHGASCAVYCTGADGGAPCIDGLHPKEETCTGALVPAPNSTKCRLGDGICGSLM